MTDSQKLNAERSRLELEMKAMHNAAEGRAWTPEEEAKFNAVVEQINAIDERLSVVEAAAMLTDSAPVAAEQNSIDQQIERAIEARIEKINKITSVSTRRSAPSPIGVSPMIVNDLNDKRAERDRALALRGWMLGREANSEEIAAADRVGLNLRSDKLALRANSTSSSAGGYTIPQGFLAEREKKIVFYNPLRSVARIIRTETGNSLPFPTIDDTSNSAGVGSENTAPSATDMTFGQITLGAYRYESLIQVSNELLRDSGLDLAGEIASLLGERIGRKEATDHATGNGTSTAQGVVTGASTGVAGATTTTITLANIMGLRNSLDFGYQQNGAFMMHQTIWNSILQLADSQSRPLFLDLLNGNAPRLLGYPVIVNNAMASSIAASAVTVLFGDFSKYYIRDAGDIEIIRLNERYADAYATGFLAVRRTDAKVAQSAAIKKLTQPAS
jgi:HK97 family phage major capsid protein